MEPEEEVIEPQVEDNEEAVVEEVVEEEAPVVVDKDAEARRQLTARAKAAEAKLKAAEAKLAKVSEGSPALDVEDYIDISTSLGGLDPVEQAYLAKQHKLTGEPMKEIRESEDFQLWNSAYKQKQEAENALKPNATQEVDDGPKSMLDKLRSASIEEKEALLREAGLYKDRRPGPQRVDIGNKVSTQ